MNTIDYEERFGEICFEEGFEEKLRGKTIEEQMQYYRIKMITSVEKTSYGEVERDDTWETVKELGNCSDVKGLIVKDGLLVGVMLKARFGQTEPCLPGQSVWVYYASEDDGVGSSCRSDVAYLIFV